MPIFDSKSLNDAITKQLNDSAIPADHRNAFAIIATSDGTVKGVLSTKVNTHWEIDSIFSVAPGKPIEGGVQVKATWILVAACLLPLASLVAS